MTGDPTETDPTLSIGELADRAGLTRRAVRFYVQRELLPPPSGRGRGARYGAAHLARLERIRELQEAGHSLEQIRAALDGSTAAAPNHPGQARTAGPGSGYDPGSGSTQWTRVPVAPGIELHLAAGVQPNSPDAIPLLQQLARQLFDGSPERVANDLPTRTGPRPHPQKETDDA